MQSVAVPPEARRFLCLTSFVRWWPYFRHGKKTADTSGHISIELIVALMIVSISLGGMIELAGFLSGRAKISRERSEGFAHIASFVEMIPWMELDKPDHYQFIQVCHSGEDAKHVLWLVEAPHPYSEVPSCKQPQTYSFGVLGPDNA